MASVAIATGEVLSNTRENAGELALVVGYSTVCCPTIDRVPAPKADIFEVVIVVEVPLATAVPTTVVPTFNSTVAPETVPETTKVIVPALVILSVLLDPVSLVADRSIAVGAAGAWDMVIV